MDVIEIDHLKKKYDNVPVLSDFSMNVKEGDIYGLLGPNGAGKTTTLRIILGLLDYDDGSAKIFGWEPKKMGLMLRRDINALPEAFSVYSWQTAPEYLSFFAALYGRKMTKNGIEGRLGQVGLEGRALKQPIGTFSQGMKKRLGLARAMINDPKVIFLDEPTNGLDPRGRREIHNLLVKLNKQNNLTIIISTHILDDVERLCNWVGILYNGKLQYQGKLTKELSNQKYRYNFRLASPDIAPEKFRLPGIDFLEKENDWITCMIESTAPAVAIEELIANGVPIVEAKNETTGLEELYLQYTAAT